MWSCSIDASLGRPGGSKSPRLHPAPRVTLLVIAFKHCVGTGCAPKTIKSLVKGKGLAFEKTTEYIYIYIHKLKYGMEEWKHSYTGTAGRHYDSVTLCAIPSYEGGCFT